MRFSSVVIAAITRDMNSLLKKMSPYTYTLQSLIMRCRKYEPMNLMSILGRYNISIILGISCVRTCIFCWGKSISNRYILSYKSF